MGWVWEVNIKQFISDDESPEAMKEAYMKITNALSIVPFPLPKRWYERCEKGIAENDVEIWNLGLKALYDWADEYRVWLGLK